jgi:hypothetical protein
MDTSAYNSNFAIVAEQFTDWVHSSPLCSEQEAVKALSLLSNLYAAAINIMTIDAERSEPEDDFENHTVSVDEWKEVYDRFSNFPFSYYSEVETPHESDPKTNYTDFIEDLTDIYQDVKEGLNIYQTGQVEQALCHWQMTFEFHWGKHVLGAMKALHCWFQDEADFSFFTQNK